MLILVIDDDDRVRQTVVLMVEELGHEVIQADSGATGIALFQSESPHLVLTDIIMPDKEGIETIGEIKAVNPQTKIIAMSGGGRIKNTDFLKLALANGADAVLAKPFDEEELAGAILKVMGDEYHPART